MTNFDVYLADAKTVAIAGHVRPDGDCAGSCLATYNYIKNYFPHVKVDLYLEPIPNIFKFMKRSEEILSEWPDDRKYDLCFQTSALTGRSQNVSTPEWCMIPVFSSIPALPEKRWRSQESLSKKELTSQR